MAKAPDRVGIRVNLTLPVHVVALLDRIAKLTGTGRATMIRDIFGSMVPELGQMAEALELAAEKKGDAYKVMGKALENVQREVDQLSLEIKTARRKSRQKKNP